MGTGPTNDQPSFRRRTPCGRGRRWPAALALAALLAPVAAVGPAAAQDAAWAPPQTVFVEESGHTADGLFLEIWRAERALLGDPITEEFRPRTGFGADAEQGEVVQYYENTALVYLPEAPAEAQVGTLDLGRQGLERALAGRPSAALLRADRRTFCGPSAAGGCLGFRETGQTVRGAFRDAWGAAGGARWLGLPLTEAYRGADGSWLQWFERGALRQPLGGEPQPLPLGRTAAERQRLDLDPIRRPADVPVYDPELFVAPSQPAPELVEPELTEPELTEPEPTELELTEPELTEPEAETLPEEDWLEPELEPAAEEAPVLAAGWTVGSYGPGPQQGGAQEVVISISNQALWAYEGGEMVLSTYVSTGTAETPEVTTPIGSWSILAKIDVQDMEGTISGEYYFVEAVPYVMYFDGLGNALHGTYWHSNFGAPMSHGCVNLPMDVAAWMYGWASVGTAVTVVP